MTSAIMHVILWLAPPKGCMATFLSSEQYALLYARLPAALVYVSFSAILSLAVNTRLSVLSGAWGSYLRELAVKKKQLSVTSLKADRKRLRREEATLAFFLGNLMKHVTSQRVALYSSMTAIGCFSIMTFLIIISVVADSGIIYPAVILLWLGLGCCMVPLGILLWDLVTSYMVIEGEARRVQEFRKFVIDELQAEKEGGIRPADDEISVVEDTPEIIHLTNFKFTKFF